MNNNVKKKDTPSHSSYMPISSSIANNYNAYYQRKNFYTLGLASFIYGPVIHAALIVLKVLTFPFKNNISNVNQLQPEECFTMSSLDVNNNEKNEKNHHVAIVTGSNTGIGFETATSLVEMGYDVILACRSRDKGEQAVKAINANVQDNEGNNNTVAAEVTSTTSQKQCGKAIFLHPLDLSSLESVRSFANAFINSKYSHLNILVNNAGAAATGKSVDNMNLCFQTNFVGHYLLTRLLLPHLLKAKNVFYNENGGIANNGKEAGRVVNLSSVTHHFAGSNLECDGKIMHNEEWWRGRTMPNLADHTYCDSKLAAILFTQELNDRYGSQGLRALSANPGAVNSDVWRNNRGFMDKVRYVLFLTNKQGASTSVAAAVGDVPKGAIYLQPYWQPWGKKRTLVTNHKKTSFQFWYSLPTTPITEMIGPYIGYAVTDCRLPSPGSSTALWNVCEEIVGLKMDKE